MKIGFSGSLPQGSSSPRVCLFADAFLSILQGAVTRSMVAAVLGLAVVLGVTGSAFGQAGSVDPGFAPYAFTTGASVTVVAVQPDGKYIVAGTFDGFAGLPRQTILRMNPDGTVDPTFTSPTFTATSTNTTISSLVLQGDGKMVLSGNFSAINGVSRTRLARLNPDGSLDATFNQSTNPDQTVSKIVPAANGQFYIFGDFNFVNGGIGRRGIARLNADGSLDSTYLPSTPGGPVGSLAGVTDGQIQPDGKVVIVGSFTTVGGQSRPRVARLNTSGSVDTGFTPGTGANAVVQRVVLQPNGALVIGGDFSTFAGSSRNSIARLTGTGALDTTFNPGTGFNSSVYGLALQADGRILAAGFFTAFNGVTRNRVARLNADGTADTTFTASANRTALGFTVLADSRILAYGSFDVLNGVTRTGIGLLTAVDASLDSTFNPGLGGLAASVPRNAVCPDGKVLVAGTFTTISGEPAVSVARLRANGQPDSSFTVGTGFNGTVQTMLCQTDGKVLIGGTFTTLNGATQNRLVRLNPDGSPDTTFSVGTGANDSVEAIAIQPDGKILIGGNFTTFNGSTVPRLARLNANGSVDATLSIGTGFNSTVNSILIQADGKILVGGFFTNFNGRNYLARLNANGSVDTTFVASLTSNVTSLGFDPTGKVVVGGNFTKGIARLLSSGAQDSTFNVGTGADSRVDDLAVQPNGAILIAGPFTAVNGVNRQKIARLNPNGSLDTTFQAGTGPLGGPFPKISKISLDAYGLIVTGDFTRIDTTLRYGIARLTTDCSYSVTPSAATFPAAGGNGSFAISASSGCAWTIADVAPWILNLSATSGTGPQTVTYSVLPNFSDVPRSSVFSVAGRPLAVSQEPAVAVTSSVTLTTQSATVLPATCPPSYANDYVIVATLTNTGGQTIYIPYFQVTDLQENGGAPPSVPFRLLTADGASCSNGGLTGSIQTTDGATPSSATLPTLLPGQSVTVRFVIAMPSLRRFRFTVTPFGGFTPPVARNHTWLPSKMKKPSKDRNGLQAVNAIGFECDLQPDWMERSLRTSESERVGALFSRRN